MACINDNTLDEDIEFFYSKGCSSELAQGRSPEAHTSDDIKRLCKKYKVSRYITHNLNGKSRPKTVTKLCVDLEEKFNQLKYPMKKSSDTNPSNFLNPSKKSPLIKQEGGGLEFLKSKEEEISIDLNNIRK